MPVLPQQAKLSRVNKPSPVTWLYAALACWLCAASLPASSAEQKILVYGDTHQEVYLGCLNCSPYEIDSIHYSYGHFGSEYSGVSIFNRKGVFGALDSNYSPCSHRALFPPIIRNEDGLNLGRLTVWENHYQANKNKELRKWLKEVVCRETEER